MRFLAARIPLLVSSLLVFAGPVFVRADVIRSVDFSSDPGWQIVGSGVNGNLFGYQTTSFAGGSPGEGGGHFTRTHLFRSYGDSIETLSLDSSLQAAGRLNFTGISFPDVGLVLGHFDPNSNASVGIVLNNTAEDGIYAAALVRFADGTVHQSDLGVNLSLNTPRTWSYAWNPYGGVLGGGTLTVSLSGADAGTVVLDVPAADRNLAATFSGFGFSSISTPDSSGNLNRPDWYIDAFVDDVIYTAAVPEPSSLLLAFAGFGGLLTIGRSAKFRRKTRHNTCVRPDSYRV